MNLFVPTAHPARLHLWIILAALAFKPALLGAGGGPPVNVALNRAAYHSSAVDFDHVAHLATDGSRDTFWQSAAETRPWIYVDLGRPLEVTGVRLDWGEPAPAGCTIQVSKEGASPGVWTDVAHVACAAGQISEAGFDAAGVRFVRLLADVDNAARGCQLREFAVLGVPPPAPARPARTLSAEDAEGRTSLDGAGWKLQNARFVQATGEEISTPTFPADAWLPARVPGTVLANYLSAGAVPDPNFGDQQRLVSESFFQNEFWYRREFIPTALAPREHFFLNFEGINWKADVFLNGKAAGHIDGAFRRGVFDVTGSLRPGQSNVLAVLIHPCANPGPTHERTLTNGTHNGGVLGRDNPTFQASLGWNWMPSVRGRDTGIWDHVFLRRTGPVALVDPFVHTTVAGDRRHAAITVQATLKNLEDAPVEAELDGRLEGGSFAQKTALAAGETKTVELGGAAYPALSLTDPKLWWPNGYGEQTLQHLRLALQAGGQPSGRRDVVFGVRELSYDTSGHILKIACNGQRIQLNGGNWGMDETMLRYEAKDYDTAVRLHREMHMTMIRNWVGQVGKEEFLDACDRYGLLVWNDFWLANPADGNPPDDPAMFMDNVRDRLCRIRNHPSLALYCGRNEGSPPRELDQGMAAETSSLDGTRYYIPNSAGGLVSGHGPYEPRPASWYFQNRGVTLHSELGIVCVPTADSMRRMMPGKDLWPISDMWGVHDFYQPRCRTYTQRVDRSYGPSANLDEFCARAQMHNLENAKAMFEAWRSRSGSGGLIWMSHPAWPSLICQFYDYYLNPTGAYFGARKANEPLHILWDAASNVVKVANNTGRDAAHLHAEAWIYNLDGTEKSHQEAPVAAGAEGVAADCFPLAFPADLSAVHFIKLRLTEGSTPISENFYWRGLKEDDYMALNDMEKVRLAGSCTRSEKDGKTFLDVHLQNPGARVALMAALKVVKSSAPAERILPIFYDDNYVSLLPHEQRDIRVEFDPALLQGDQPRVMIDGWNVLPSTLAPADGPPG